MVGIGLSFVPHFLDIELTPDLVLYRAAAAAALRGGDPHLAWSTSGRTGARSCCCRSGWWPSRRSRSGSSRWWVIPGITLAAGVRARRRRRAAGRGRRHHRRPPGRHAAPHRLDPRGREPGQRRDRAGRAEHRDRGDHRRRSRAWHVGWDFVARGRSAASLDRAGRGVRAGHGPQAHRRPGARHHAVVRRAVRRVPAGARRSTRPGVLAVVVTGLILGHKAPRLQSARVADRREHQLAHGAVPARERRVPADRAADPRSDATASRDDAPAVVDRSSGRAWRCWSRRSWRASCGCSAFVGVLPRCCGRRAWDWRVSAGGLLGRHARRGHAGRGRSCCRPTPRSGRCSRWPRSPSWPARCCIQGLTLPWLVRRLGLPRPGRRRGRAAGGRAGHRGRARRASPSSTRSTTDDDPPEVIDQLRERAMRRTNQIWEQLGRSQTRARAAGGDLPAAAAADARRPSAARSSRRATRGAYDDEVLRAALTAIDLEESLLDRVEDAAARVDDELSHPRRAGRRLRAPARRAARRRRRDTPERLRGVPARRHPLGAPAAVPDLRARRAAATPRSRKHASAHFARDRASGHAQHRAGRGLALVLRRRPARLMPLAQRCCGRRLSCTDAAHSRASTRRPTTSAGAAAGTEHERERRPPTGPPLPRTTADQRTQKSMSPPGMPPPRRRRRPSPACRRRRPRW